MNQGLNSTLKEYKLEVIADSDGHKDYKTFTVKEDRRILSMSPDPMIDNITINYKLGSANSAFFRLTNILLGAEYNYLIDLDLDYKSLNLTGLTNGQYIMSLVTDNVIVDSKNLIKN